MNKITIAIDAMGGDVGPEVTVPAAAMAVKKHPDLNLILVGAEPVLKPLLSKYGLSDCAQVSLFNAMESVGMDELPSHALRNKKDSSMRRAIDLVKEGGAQACVSAGNTGALMATARFVLKTLPGIDRPAIISELPSIKGRTHVIDLGANVDSCAEHLFQFAVMGSALIQAIDKKEHPKIALLNIGVEEIKGNDKIKRTAHMLAECPLMNYVGYVEGDHFYSGEVDLIVCDGFVGNVALKASEGIAKLTQHKFKAALTKNWITKLCAVLALPAINSVKKQMDPAKHNGATLIGLNGIVVKSHGGANARAFYHAIEEAVVEVQNDVVNLVRDQIADFVEQGLLL